jgi:hypothetical protein
MQDTQGNGMRWCAEDLPCQKTLYDGMTVAGSTVRVPWVGSTAHETSRYIEALLP